MPKTPEEKAADQREWETQMAPMVEIMELIAALTEGKDLQDLTREEALELQDLSRQMIALCNNAEDRLNNIS